MSIKAKALGAVTALTLLGGLTIVGSVPSQAATTQCGSGCIKVFSPIFGQNFIESVRHGVTKVGQPTILAAGSSTDPAGDFLPLHPATGGLVSNFYTAGMVSSDVNSHYGSLPAVQLEYAPFGNPTGLCSAVAQSAFNNEALSLQPCSTPGTTVWIIDPQVAPTSDAGDFAIINGSTTDFTHPFSMTYIHRPPARIRLNNLELSSSGTAPITQLWNRSFGPAN